MMGRIGMPEIVIILFISLVTLAPIVIGVWLALRTRGKHHALEARIDALERGARQP